MGLAEQYKFLIQLQVGTPSEIILGEEEGEGRERSRREKEGRGGKEGIRELESNTHVLY